MVRYDIYWKLVWHRWDTKQLGNINSWIIIRVIIFQISSHIFFCKLKVSKSFHANVHIHRNVISLHFIICNILTYFSLVIKAYIVIFFLCTRFCESNVMYDIFLIWTLNLKLIHHPIIINMRKYKSQNIEVLENINVVNMSLTSNKSCFDSSIFELSSLISFFKWLKFDSELCLNFTNSIYNLWTYCT